MRPQTNLLIDLGGTSCKLALVNDFDNLIDIPSPAKPQDLIKEVINKIKDQKIETIKVTAAGHWNKEQILEQSHNLPNYIGYPIWQELAKHYSAKVELYNDMHLAAYGELVIGQQNQFDNLLYLNLGTGIGASFYDRGKIFSQKYSPCLRLDLRANPRGIFYSKSTDKTIEASIDQLSADLIDLALFFSPQIITIGGGKAEHCWQKIIEPAIKKAQEYLEQVLSYQITMTNSKLKYPALEGLKISHLAYGESPALS